MKTITCDVCGMVLDSKTPLTIPHKSDMFDYDLCADCKMKERAIDMRKVYLERLKEVANMVLIDMEMPKSCWDCPFCLDFEFLDPYECAACMYDFEDGIDIYEKSKPEWCPLKPFTQAEPQITTNIYDQEEIRHNCTVQILRNSVTGETSVGWWKEEQEK